VETVDLPTPPFPEATAILYLTPERICSRRTSLRSCLARSDVDGHAHDLDAGTAFTAASASRPICAAAFWFSVLEAHGEGDAAPLDTDVMDEPERHDVARESRKFDAFSASRICSLVGILLS